MSRVIISCHGEAEEGSPKFVIGWDTPMSTYFWQVMGEGDDEGIALASMGNNYNELATWQQFMNSLPDEHVNSFSEDDMRKILEIHQNNPDASNCIVDTTNWPGWKAEVIADYSGLWAGNAIVVGTKAEAERYAKDLANRWFLVREWRVVRTSEQPNYKIDTETGSVVAVS